MRTPYLSSSLEDARVHPVRNQEDEAAAFALLRSGARIAFDCETAGINFFDELRLVQFSDQRDAFAFNPHQWPQLVHELAEHPHTVAHNAPFDCQHLARFTGKPVAEILKGVTDTFILAHLVDPRDARDGGVGHHLKDLAAHYVDENAPHGDKLLKARFKELGYKQNEAWALIDIEDPTYVLYGGIDCIITARLVDELTKLVARHGLGHLVKFDHQVQTITSTMRERGIAIDLEYAQGLLKELERECEQAERMASALGCENVNSPTQVAEALKVRGIELTEKTDSGAPKVDRIVLESLNDELATQVLKAKGARKAVSSWVAPMIDHGQRDGRVHCNIRSLKAKTGRMSISEPPLQQLPSNDWRVRRCLISDNGSTLISADFAQVELRVLAALANETRMIDVFKAGEDLHGATAAMLFGEDYTDSQRSLAKGTAFGVVYGGGPKKLAEQAGVKQVEAKKVIDSFNRSYPRVTRWSAQLIESIKYARPIVITETGRRIPVDKRYAYKAVNFAVQSLAADVFKASLLKLEEAGLGPSLLLPVHDEVIAQAPNTEAEQVAQEIAATMSDVLGAVPIQADSEIVGTNWGAKYAPKELQQ